MKAYFMISVTKEFYQDGQMEEKVAELEAIPEVRCVEPVSSACDLLVEIEAPIRVVFVANKILVKEWVKDLHVLKVEPLQTSRNQKLAVCDILKAKATC